MIIIKNKIVKLPEGAEGYLYLEIKPHKAFDLPHLHTKIEPGQRELHLPKGLNPKKVVRAWISRDIIEPHENKTAVDKRNRNLWHIIKAWFSDWITTTFSRNTRKS